MWLQTLIERVISEGGIQIVEDIPYEQPDSRGHRKAWLLKQGIKDIRFRAIGERTPEEVPINKLKTFREFFVGKHPECDVTIMGIPGEKLFSSVCRLTQTMADYMDYMAERLFNVR
jgi:hypothetical protein